MTHSPDQHGGSVSADRDTSESEEPTVAAIAAVAEQIARYGAWQFARDIAKRLPDVTAETAAVVLARMAAAGDAETRTVTSDALVSDRPQYRPLGGRGRYCGHVEWLEESFFADAPNKQARHVVSWALGHHAGHTPDADAAHAAAVRIMAGITGDADTALTCDAWLTILRQPATDEERRTAHERREMLTAERADS